MIAIGKHLRHLGYEVVISIAEPYAHLAEEVGLHAETVISTAKFNEAIGDASVWNPVRGPIQVFKLVMRDLLERQQEVIRRFHEPGRTVLVAHPLDLASRIFRDADPGTPMISAHLQPVILRTANEPPRLSPWWFELSKPAWAIRTCYSIVDHLLIDPILRGPVNQMRREYGLAPIRRIMDSWLLSPDGIMALYPEWFAPGTIDFHSELFHCGFPLDDIDGDHFELPTNEPIVFTSGTAHQHCRAFFEHAVAACAELQRPGLLLSSFPENFPDPLPRGIDALSYASFHRLLPRCSAIVHHGGIGTTSQALAAGIPQVICPLAFDQFDNATRVERLGCGRWLRSRSRLAETLRSLLDGAVSDSRETLDAVARSVGNANGAENAARRIDQIATNHFQNKS